MPNRKVDHLSVEELEAVLYRKKRALRRQRLQRLKDEGRVVEVAGLQPPSPQTPKAVRPTAVPTGALRRYNPEPTEQEPETPARSFRFNLNWRWLSNKALLLVEVGAVVGLFVIVVGLLGTMRELNQDAAVAQANASQPLTAVVEPTAEPLIKLVVLPSGHRPPIEGQPPQPGEAGDIPAHLLPYLDAYVPPPPPPPAPEQPRNIQISAININAPVVQGDDWEQLKKGVGQHIGSAMPGTEGNMVLSAHNDIYGEIFRHLDKLAPGDEVVVSTSRQSYTYVVNEIRVVDPTDVWVMDPTEHASLTLISCYPYLINNKRIVVFADLVDVVPEDLQQG
ncbi:MAG: class D sortase [Anaerolineales bacterium]|nr:class D sortase [Anaerolineales bacterium]